MGGARGGSLPTSNFGFKSSADETPQQQLNQKIQADSSESSSSAFCTARQQLAMNDQRKFGGRTGGGGKSQSNAAANNSYASGPVSPSSYGSSKRSLGARRGPGAKFIPPVLNRNNDDDDSGQLSRPNKSSATGCGGGNSSDEPVDPRLKNFEPRMLELIMSEIMDHGPPVTWDDIAGLEFVKKTIKEIVIWPMLRPDIFTGLRGPPKGLLLFGPPGTGKTLIGKCIASQSKSTFFSISASSLTSKWVGEGEKMVRALFAVARVHQPAVVFIDEIDSLLSQRSDSEHESSRRIKTEFLVQLDGTSTGEDDRILVVGATNRPQEIDEAARRRFVKRLYVPLPEREARKQIMLLLMSTQSHALNPRNFDDICDQTDGYSGADMANLCREAALGPIRSLAFVDIENIAADDVRPISCEDFIAALKQVRASVSDRDLNVYIDWNKLYGSWAL